MGRKSTERPTHQTDAASRHAAASRAVAAGSRTPSHDSIVDASPRSAPVRALQRVADSSAKVVQAKMKADSLAALVKEQLELQGDAKANPKDYAGRYTTVGLEHEFAVMTSGPLRGVSHLELAKSTERMPYHNVPYVLETDAQNALELVSPPYLIETVAEGVAIPDPDEVQKVDALTTQTLASHVKGELTFDTLLAGMARDPGLHFDVGNIPKKQRGAVRIGRENVTPKTDEPLGGKPISKGNRELSAAEVGGISLHAAGQEGGDKSATMQVNFATDAATFHLLQELHGETGDDYQQMYEKVEDDFRTLLYAEAFAEEIAKTKEARESAVASFHAAAERATMDLQRAMGVCRAGPDGDEPVTKRKLDHALISAENSLARLQPRLNDVEARLARPGVKGTTLRDSVTLLTECDAAMRYVHKAVGGGEWFLKALRASTEGKSAYVAREDEAAKAVRLPLEGSSGKDSGKDDDSSEDVDSLALPKGRRPDTPWLDSIPHVGEGDKNSQLALFLDLLARTLSGQLSVLAQEVVRTAQSKRFSSPGDKTLGESTLHTMVLSRVKDVHQIWIKDSILSIGLGILTPQDWERVRVMIRKGALRKTLTAAAASQEIKIKSESVAPPKLFAKLVDAALVRVAKAISEHRLNTDKPRKVDALSPSERPPLFDHDPAQIGARQDTYIPSNKVQDLGLWGDRRLHVVEVRRDSVARLREVQALLAKGKKPSAALLREVQMDAARDPSRRKPGAQDALGTTGNAEPNEPLQPGRPTANGYVLTAAQIASLTHAGRDNLDVLGDGNCLFHAVIAVGAHPGPVQALRNAVASSVSGGAIDVRPFNLSPAKTAKAIRTPGSYNNGAGDATPSLIAHALGVTFIIHNENGTTTTLDGGNAATYHLIRFLRPGAHYHATQPLVAQALAQPDAQGLAQPDAVRNDDD